jgi:hypothetical protein
VPRFFFHLRNDVNTTDEEEQMLPDAGAAVEQATAYARDMAAESVLHGKLDLAHFIEVSDDAGAHVARIMFGDAVRVTTGTID